MHIRTIQHAVPSKKVTNDDIMATFRQESEHRLSKQQMAALEKQVRETLDTAGTQVRYKLDTGEKAIDFVLAAGRKAIAEAGIKPGDVDFLIYTGVGRGWLEPAMANVVQSELGMPNATCFDILDACATWLRAMQVAHSLIQSRNLQMRHDCQLRKQPGSLVLVFRDQGRAGPQAPGRAVHHRRSGDSDDCDRRKTRTTTFTSISRTSASISSCA